MGRRLSWPLRSRPDGRGEVWRWHLGALGQLPAARAALRRLLDGAGCRVEDADPSGEQLVLAFDELASNALRHGEQPVVATVVAGSGGWLLDVSDHSPDVMPTPAVDRDPALGGLGLHMVAQMSVAHGWYVDGSRKHVWACLPAAADEEAAVPA